MEVIFGAFSLGPHPSSLEREVNKGPALSFTSDFIGCIQEKSMLEINKKGIAAQHNELSRGIRGINIMWAFIKITLLLLIHYMLMYSYIYSAKSSPLYSSCQIEGQFHLNGMHKAGDLVLGGLFEIHFFSVFPDLSFTSEPEQPTCHG